MSGTSPVMRNVSSMVSASRPAASGLAMPGIRMANSSPPSRAMIWRSSSTRGDARGDGLQHGVAGGVAEQVVDFLEAVEIEAEHGETLALAERRDLLVEPAR